jgi:hypothetical protein
MSREIVSPEELLRRADTIKSMSQSEPFRWLIEAADRDAHQDWARGKSVEEREAAFQRLLGVKSLETQVLKIVNAGVAAAAALAKQAKEQAKEQEKE